MAGLADDWPENRQTCVDVLCAYLRLPYEADPGADAPVEKRLTFQASREVRHTVIRVITAHLKDGARVTWQGHKFDFTGVVFDEGDFGRAIFGGDVFFTGAEFSGGTVDFQHAKFYRSVDFTGAKFSSGVVLFYSAEFLFTSTAYFMSAKFSGGKVYFQDAKFSGLFYLSDAEFSDGEVHFNGAKFSGGTVGFNRAKFSGGTVGFNRAEFSATSEVTFADAEFSGTSVVTFGKAEFSGGRVDFTGAKFTGGVVGFAEPGDWSVPPTFPGTGPPPSNVRLPKKEDQSQA